MIEIIVMVAIFIIMIIYICWALNDLVKTSTYKRNKNKMFHWKVHCYHIIKVVIQRNVL